MRPVFKTKMLICQSKATLVVKISFGDVIHPIDPDWEPMF